MNTFQNTFKYLRLVNVKTALNTVKECKPTYIRNVQREKLIFAEAKTLNFAPHSIGVQIGIEPSQGPGKQEPLSYIPIVNPRSIIPLIENWRKDEIGLPTPQQEEVQAARLMVIRRKKMKKHQRRKLWKRMRHRWAQIKQRRRQRKEKNFQAELLALVKEADKFSAEQYVADKLARVNRAPLPARWRGKRLPQFIIRQLMGIDKKINYKHTDVYKA